MSSDETREDSIGHRSDGVGLCFFGVMLMLPLAASLAMSGGLLVFGNFLPRRLGQFFFVGISFARTYVPIAAVGLFMVGFGLGTAINAPCLTSNVHRSRRSPQLSLSGILITVAATCTALAVSLQFSSVRWWMMVYVTATFLVSVKLFLQGRTIGNSRSRFVGCVLITLGSFFANALNLWAIVRTVSSPTQQAPNWLIAVGIVGCIAIAHYGTSLYRARAAQKLIP